MKNYTLIGLMFISILLLGGAAIKIEYDNVHKGEVNVHFDDSVMDDLNMMYINTSSPWEFVGYLYGNQDNITKVGLLGYHNAVNNEISLTYDEIEPSEITIHSHPKINSLSGMCYLSDMDRSSMEIVVCVMCGIDKIRCYIIH